jgi:GAF domain-containing protein
MMGALFVYYISRVSFFTIKEYQSTANALQKTSNELQVQQNNLGIQINLGSQNNQFRTVQLSALMEVARTISMGLKTDESLPIISDLISNRFGFQQADIFLLNESNENEITLAVSSAGRAQESFQIDTNSLVGLAARKGVLITSTEFKSQIDGKASLEMTELISEVALPLQIGDQLIGVLDVQNENRKPFSEDDINILITLANLVAISIQNTRSFDQLRKALSSAEKGYQQVTQRSWSEISRKTSNPGYIYSQKKLVQIKKPEDIAILKSKATGIEEILPSEQNQPASITVPIKLRDQVIGVLDIKSRINRQKWSVDEIALVRAIADRGGQALENARLLNESQQRASRELAIGEISSKISSSIQVESILRTAAEELSRALNGSEVLVQLNSETAEPFKENN